MKVKIKTPSRLHISMIDLKGTLGRLYGSVGMAINRPNIILEAEPANRIYAEGSRASRAEAYAKKWIVKKRYNQGVHLTINSDIPQHVGLGSGTQLALAVGTAVSLLNGHEESPEELALNLGRSQRSSIGMYAFKLGGLIIDGGHRTHYGIGIPPLLFRAKLPADWRFVVGQPDILSSRSGKQENNAFKRLEPPSDFLISKASHIVLMQMMPSILEEDITVFGASMTHLDAIFGDYWEKIQGGRYSHPIIEKGVRHLLDCGAHGIGQSSWGPVFFGLVEAERADIIEKSLCCFLQDMNIRAHVFTAEPNNHGAEIIVED